MPGGSAMTLNTPRSFVTVVCGRISASLFTVTVTPGSTAFCWSITTPVMVPVCTCADAEETIDSVRAISRHTWWGDNISRLLSESNVDLPIEPSADTQHTRRDDGQRPKERAPRAPARVLNRIRVRHVVDIRERRNARLSHARDAFDAQVEQRDMILPPRVQRLGGNPHVAVVQ